MKLFKNGLLLNFILLLTIISLSSCSAKKDVTISAWTSTLKPDLTEGEYLYEISVPVADFMASKNDVNDYEEVQYILLDELDYSKKLLSVKVIII